MTTKKPATLLALAGTAALVVAGPATLASPPTGADTQPDAGATASSLPVGDVNTALTSKSGQTTQDVSAPITDEVDPASVVSIIVQLDDGADRAAALASINEAVAGAFPGSSAQVEREYDKAVQGFALSAPAGSLDAIRAGDDRSFEGPHAQRETPGAQDCLSCTGEHPVTGRLLDGPVGIWQGPRRRFNVR